jgi:hypothetical protein
MKRSILAFVALALLLGASSVRGQQLAPILDRNASGAKLGMVLTQLAGLWARSDASAIASFAASSGVSINVDGNPISPLSGRQVAAALRHMFEQQETVALRSGLAQIVGGAPARAFGEMTWSVRARGTTIPEHSTVFIALVWEGDAWRVNQIRVIR